MLKLLADKIAQSEKVQTAVGLLRSGSNVSCEGLIGSSDAVVTFQLIKDLRFKQSLIVTSDANAYANVLDDLTALTASVDEKLPPILCYPEEDVLPYDEKEPTVSIGSLRQECIEKLLEKTPCIVITAIRALSKRIPHPEKLSSYRIELTKDTPFQFQYLTELLTELGFEKQDVVDQVGTFAIRGGIVDIYAYSMENPVRIEFFGDTIESIREFDVMSQRSVRQLDKVILFPKNDVRSETREEGSLLDYLSPDAMVFEFEPDMTGAALEKFQTQINEYHDKKAAKQISVAPPCEIYFTANEVKKISRNSDRFTSADRRKGNLILFPFAPVR